MKILFNANEQQSVVLFQLGPAFCVHAWVDLNNSVQLHGLPTR